MTTNHIIDIAIFKLKNGEWKNRNVLGIEWEKFLSGCEGFVSRQLLQSDNDKNTLADIIVWESAEAGNKAFAAMQQHADFVKINSLIDSIVIAERYLKFQPDESK